MSVNLSQLPRYVWRILYELNIRDAWCANSSFGQNNSRNTKIHFLNIWFTKARKNDTVKIIITHSFISSLNSTFQNSFQFQTTWFPEIQRTGCSLFWHQIPLHLRILSKATLLYHAKRFNYKKISIGIKRYLVTATEGTYISLSNSSLVENITLHFQIEINLCIESELRHFWTNCFIYKNYTLFILQSSWKCLQPSVLRKTCQHIQMSVFIKIKLYLSRTKLFYLKKNI